MKAIFNSFRKLLREYRVALPRELKLRIVLTHVTVLILPFLDVFLYLLGLDFYIRVLVNMGLAASILYTTYRELYRYRPGTRTCFLVVNSLSLAASCLVLSLFVLVWIGSGHTLYLSIIGMCTLVAYLGACTLLTLLAALGVVLPGPESDLAAVVLDPEHYIKKTMDIQESRLRKLIMACMLRNGLMTIRKRHSARTCRKRLGKSGFHNTRSRR